MKLRPRLVMKLVGFFVASVSVVAQANSPSVPERWYQGAKSLVDNLWGHDAKNWLMRIGPALREQNYQGTLVMIAGGRIETFGVFHAFDDGRERMRLVALTGMPREVIRDGKLVMCIGTGLLPVGYDDNVTGRWNPAEQFADVAHLDAYQAKLGAVGRVAGREAQIIDLRARDEWRYGFRLWLDKETALPLQIVLLGENGQALEQMAFTEIKLGAAPIDADLQPSTHKGLQRIQTLSPGKQADPGWRIDSPPSGYRLRAARRLGESVQLLYSDGLANVSVYIEPMPSNQQGDSAMRRGAVNVRSVWQNGRRIVAIGKVPAATVDRFVLGVREPKVLPKQHD